MCFISVTSSAQTIDKIKLEKRLDSIFSSFNKNTPGVAVTVIENGKVIAKKAYGLASLEHMVPFTHNTVVRLPYSEGREFISIAAVLMEQEGLLSLEDKVRKYFPKLPAWAEPVSIWDLLNHRSGFADEWDAVLLTQASMGNRFDVSQFLNLLYTQPKEEVVPGKGYMYSNSDFGLLRLLLEKASGENLRDWMKQKMFDPLGMKATLLHDNANEVIPNYALKYSLVANRKFSSITNDKTSPGGNYHIATTANDLERWAAVLAEKNSEISKAAKRLMNNAQLMPGAGKNFVFGYKLRNDNGNTIILHQGVNNFTYMSRIPEKNLAIIVFGNLITEYENYHKNIRQTVLKTPAATTFTNKRFTVAPVSYSKKELEQFAGRYIDEDTVSFESFVKAKKNITHFFIEHDSLKLRMGNNIIPFVPVAKNVFKIQHYELYIEFLPSNEGLMRFSAHDHPQKKIYNSIKDTLSTWKPSKELLASSLVNITAGTLIFIGLLCRMKKGNWLSKDLL